MGPGSDPVNQTNTCTLLDVTFDFIPDGIDQYTDRPLYCELSVMPEVLGGCFEIASVLTYNDRECANGPVGVRIGRTGIQWALVEVK